MIITDIKSPMLETYENTHPRLKAAFAALKKLVADDTPDGKYEIDGENVKAIITTAPTKPVANKKFELHHKYIDIQYIARGCEIMGNESTDKLTPMPESKPDADFYYMNDEYDRVYLHAGEFAVIFPEEAHAPGIAVDDQPTEVKKIVLKVLF